MLRPGKKSYKRKGFQLPRTRRETRTPNLPLLRRTPLPIGLSRLVKLLRALGRIRTCSLPVRNRALYPLSYQGGVTDGLRTRDLLGHIQALCPTLSYSHSRDGGTRTHDPLLPKQVPLPLGYISSARPDRPRNVAIERSLTTRHSLRDSNPCSSPRQGDALGL